MTNDEYTKTPDADEIEEARGLVLLLRERGNDRSLIAHYADTLLRALDAERERHAHQLDEDHRENVEARQRVQVEIDALRDEVEQKDRALKQLLGCLNYEQKGGEALMRNIARAALDPTPPLTLAQAAREHIDELTRQLITDNAFGVAPESDPKPDAEESEA